jgi:outer membrane cobalamin receptor
MKFIGKRGTEGGYTLNRYALVDLSVEKAFSKKLTAAFFADNLFGMEYQQVYGYPSPGRTFGIRIQANSQSNSLYH